MVTTAVTQQPVRSAGCQACFACRTPPDVRFFPNRARLRLSSAGLADRAACGGAGLDLKFGHWDLKFYSAGLRLVGQAWQPALRLSDDNAKAVPFLNAQASLPAMHVRNTPNECTTFRGQRCPRSQERHSRKGARVVLTQARFRVCLLAEEHACAF
ncbi:MAG: hypothetical protein LBM04_08765 [Opitutaceae bacterium]|jgi:hypothetical protein|nr:hypothetical protein [Opitutaceae bacterium]